MSHFDKQSEVEDYKLREKRLCIPFAIVHHATAASKTYSSDLAASMVLSLEGLTAVAAAADSGCNFTTEVDSTGIFGVLLQNLGTLSKLYDVSIVNLSAGTATVSRKGASSTGITASGNVAVSIDWSGNLATTDLSGTIIVDYRVRKA